MGRTQDNVDQCRSIWQAPTELCGDTYLGADHGVLGKGLGPDLEVLRGLAMLTSL